MYIFSIVKTLDMPVHDFAEFSPLHYRIELLAEDRYKITSDKLKYLVEAMLILNYNNQLATLSELSKIVGQKGTLESL